MARRLAVSLLLAGLLLLSYAPAANAWQSAQFVITFQGSQKTTWEFRQDITHSPCGVGFSGSGREDANLAYFPVVVQAVPGAFFPPPPTELPVLVNRKSTHSSWNDGQECGSGCEDCGPPEPPPPPDCGVKAMKLVGQLSPSGAGMEFNPFPSFGRRLYRNCPTAGGTRGRWAEGGASRMLFQGFAPWLIFQPGPPPSGFLFAFDHHFVSIPPGGHVETRTEVRANVQMVSFVPDPPPQAQAEGEDPGDRTPPSMRSLSVGRNGVIRYWLSEPADAVFMLERRGRLSRGSFTARGRSGRNRARLPRRFARRLRTRGSWRLVAVAVDPAGNPSSARRAAIRLPR